MRDFHRISLALIVVFLAYLIPVSGWTHVDAQSSTLAEVPQQVSTTTPEVVSSLLGDGELVTFEDFGFGEITMQGPFATSGYFFDLPPTWNLQPGAELRLVLDTFYTGVESIDRTGFNSAYGGTLIVQYNYITITAIDLNQEGQREISIPIPIDVLTRLGRKQSHSLQFILDSGINCDIDFKTTVVVRTSSQLYFPHEQILPPVDLTLLPVPFYQDSFNKDSMIIVVPDQPSSGELQAALAVSAGFGQMTFNRLLISVKPIGQLTNELLFDNNIVFIGKPDGLSILRDLPLPARIVDNAYVYKEMLPSDGLIQLLVSPWNNEKVIMIVGGNEDLAVINAGRAVSTGELRVGSNPSIAIVQNADPIAPIIDPTSIDQTFDDLGYANTVAGNVGYNSLSYYFDLPQGYILGPDAYLSLVFSHSSLLEYDRSSVTVRLNEEPIGSIQLSEETTEQTEKRINLPASVAHSGKNHLRLDIFMEPRNECVPPLLEGLWMRIDSSSKLHLPLVPSPEGTSFYLDLGRYPAPFAFNPVMNDLAFVLAPSDPVGWDAAAHVAFSLGYINSIKIAGLETYYASDVPDVAQQNRDMIIIGRPSTLEIVGELFDDLPAPFEPGTDLAIEDNLQVSYRLGKDVNIGYLELFQNPMNSDRSILFIGGSSDIGVGWAADAILLGRFRSQLNGNLAFINGEQVVSTDTRIIQGSQSILPTVAAVDTIPRDIVENGAAFTENSNWLLIGIFVTLGGIVIVLVILGIQITRKRRSGNHK